MYKDEKSNITFLNIIFILTTAPFILLFNVKLLCWAHDHLQTSSSMWIHNILLNFYIFIL